MRKSVVQVIVSLFLGCFLVTSVMGQAEWGCFEVHAEEVVDMYADSISKLPKINEETVKKRIVELCYAMGIYDVEFDNIQEKTGKIFTVNEKVCTSHKSWAGSCPNCKNTEVILKGTWLRDAAINKEGDLIELPANPSEQLPISYTPDNMYQTPGAWTCVGFSHFAFWYLYRDNAESVVYPRKQETLEATKALRGTYTQIDNVEFSKKNKEKIRDAELRIGDLVSLKYGDSVHEMIFLGYNENGIWGLDCNGWDYRRVAVHLWEYGRKSNDKITVTRAPNYEPDYVYPIESAEFYHYTDGESQYSYCVEEITFSEEKSWWDGVLDWISVLFGGGEEEYAPQREVETFTVNELTRTENTYLHRAHEGCDIKDSSIVEYQDQDGVVWYKCEQAVTDSNTSEQEEEVDSSVGVGSAAGNAVGNASGTSTENTAGNTTGNNLGDIIENIDENTFEDTKENSNTVNDVSAVGNEITQYKYHHYTNGTRYCVCATYGQEHWQEKEIWREDTGWLNQPLRYSRDVQHTRVSGCDNNGCLEGSWSGGAYVDSNDVVWYREETRKVSIGYHYTDGNGNYSYCADELSSPLKKDKYFVPSFVKTELDLSKMQKQKTISHSFHPEDYCPIWDCSIVEYKDGNDVIWYVIIVEAEKDAVSNAQTMPKETNEYIEVPNVTVQVYGVPMDSGKNEADHHWMNASCTAAQTCSECGVTIGSELGHLWSEATCCEPKTCMVCNAVEGNALGHNWYDDGSREYCTECGLVNATWNLVQDWTPTALVAGESEKVETKTETKVQYRWTRALAWSNYGGKPHSIAGSNSHMEGLGLVFNDTYVAVGDSDIFRTVTTGYYSEGKKGTSNGTYCRQASNWSDSDAKLSGFYDQETITVDVIYYKKYHKVYQ